MTKRQEIDERRMDFYILMAHGVPLCEAVGTIRAKYGTSKRRLYDEWAMRDQWGPKFIEAPRSTTIVQDTLFRFGELRR